MPATTRTRTPSAAVRRDDAAHSADAGGSLASGLRIAVMRLARRLRQERSSDEFTLSQLSALATLERCGPLTLGALAAAEKVQPPSMTRIVASLEAGGVASRAPHATDGRQVVLTVTDHGRALLAADRARRDVWLSRRLAELPPDDVTALRRAAEVLERLAER